jgi:hypothetical protein
MMGLFILNLAEELVTLIIMILDVKSIFRCSEVSQSINFTLEPSQGKSERLAGPSIP